MFNKRCKKCGKEFHLKDARVDEHWKDGFSMEPAYAYCPFCNEIQDDVLPRSVDAAKIINIKFVITLILFVLVGFIAIATGSLKNVGLGGILIFGVYLAKYGATKDHQYIGWFLALVAIGTYAAITSLT
jgi:hypothetical protein